MVPTHTHTLPHTTRWRLNQIYVGGAETSEPADFLAIRAKGGAAINKSHRTADQKRSDGFSLNYCFTDVTAHTHTHTLKDCNDCTHQHTNRLNTLTHEVLIKSLISAGATWLAGTFCAFFHRFKHFVTFWLLTLRCAVPGDVFMWDLLSCYGAFHLPWESEISARNGVNKGASSRHRVKDYCG